MEDEREKHSEEGRGDRYRRKGRIRKRLNSIKERKEE